jgi:DNA-binding response OmpR family regulator
VKRFLIVDDEPAIGRFIQKVAVSCGYDSVVTASAEAFMDEVAAYEPDCVAMDLSMPDCDGIELLRFLATAKCRAAILIISGFDTRVLDTAGELGAALGLRIFGTLTKPIRVADLRAAIEGVEKVCAQ